METDREGVGRADLGPCADERVAGTLTEVVDKGC